MAGKLAAKDLAYELVKRQILSRDLVPGAFVTEPEIAAQLGISRTPVREAFLRLEAERLLTLVPHRGAQITPISAHEMSDVMEARLVVELWCAQSVLDGRHVAVAERLDQALDASVVWSTRRTSRGSSNSTATSTATWSCHRQ